MNKLLFFLLFLGTSFLKIYPNNEIENLFTKANEAYALGQYEEACQHFNTCLQSGESASIHFNLGNSYFARQELGKALFHYKKALLLNPLIMEAKEHADFLQKELGLSSDDPKDTIINNSWLTIFSKKAFKPALMIGFWLMIYSSLCSKKALKKGLQTFGILFLILGGATFHLSTKYLKLGIVFSENAPIKVAPTESSPCIDHAREGALLSIKKQHNQYFLIQIGRKKEGWILGKELGILD